MVNDLSGSCCPSTAGSTVHPLILFAGNELTIPLDPHFAPPGYLRGTKPIERYIYFGYIDT